MRRFSGVIGVQQGTRILFSDFASDGAMWAGSGPREVRHSLTFAEPFLAPPALTIGMSMWDVDHRVNSRMDLVTETVTETGFDLVFRTWGDSRIARVRADWMAIGQLRDDDTWQVL
jgi:H-type lectin domain